MARRSGEALKYLTSSVTQGSNDAFVQGSIITGLSAVGNAGYQIREILFYTPGLGNTDAAAFYLSLTRKSFTAVPAVTERSLIWLESDYVKFTTSGVKQVSRTRRIKFDDADNLLIVEDPIYFQLDSDSTSAANVASVRIGYIEVALSEVDRLQLVANTLAS